MHCDRVTGHNFCQCSRACSAAEWLALNGAGSTPFEVTVCLLRHVLVRNDGLTCVSVTHVTRVSQGFYDRKKLWWKEVEDTLLCAACAPPGGGRQEMTSRFLRHFTTLCVQPPSAAVRRVSL
jgi:hypothetical protein